MEVSLVEHALPVLGTNGYPLQSEVVYGPIHSRRFGWSLGINPLPLTYKFCDFDCVYCQYGWTPARGNDVSRTNEKLKSADELLDGIEQSFRQLVAERTPVDVVTIAGNGEPTLHPEFLKLVKGLLRLRDRYFPKRPVGILSDSSQCHRQKVKEALGVLDERYMKLDAGDSETVITINKPRGNFDFQRTIGALRRLRGVTIQSLFIHGSFGNTGQDQIDKWITAIGYIVPKAVQVYTIDRPPADSGVCAVPLKRLKEIARLCQTKTGTHSEVFD